MISVPFAGLVPNVVGQQASTLRSTDQRIFGDGPSSHDGQSERRRKQVSTYRIVHTTFSSTFEMLMVLSSSYFRLLFLAVLSVRVLFPAILYTARDSLFLTYRKKVSKPASLSPKPMLEVVGVVESGVRDTEAFSVACILPL